MLNAKNKNIARRKSNQLIQFSPSSVSLAYFGEKIKARGFTVFPRAEAQFLRGEITILDLLEFGPQIVEALLHTHGSRSYNRNSDRSVRFPLLSGKCYHVGNNDFANSLIHPHVVLNPGVNVHSNILSFNGVAIYIWLLNVRYITILYHFTGIMSNYAKGRVKE